MARTTRRDFLKTATILSGMAFSGNSFAEKNNPLLSFSTLGCPDWTFEKIINFAVKNNYNGIEIRGIQREMDLTKCPEFKNPESIALSGKLIEDKNLKIIDLGSSAEMHHENALDREKNLDESKRFIDLAHALHCPFIRVFPNSLPKERERNATIEIIIKSLDELGEHANGSGVTVLMESHGDLVKTKDLKYIMQSVKSVNVGMVWDIVNMWSATKEPPEQAYEQLKAYIRHTHIKDLKIVNGKEQYTLLGKGETPVFEAIDVLRKGGYKGYYSFEWEKLWHPEIEEPEIALGDYIKVMKQHFNK